MFVCIFPHFYWALGAQVKKYITSGSPKNNQVWFGFLKTQELRVKFLVGFWPNPALRVCPSRILYKNLPIFFTCHFCDNPIRNSISVFRGLCTQQWIASHRKMNLIFNQDIKSLFWKKISDKPTQRYPSFDIVIRHCHSTLYPDILKIKTIIVVRQIFARMPFVYYSQIYKSIIW